MITNLPKIGGLYSTQTNAASVQSGEGQFLKKVEQNLNQKRGGEFGWRQLPENISPPNKIFA